MVASETEHAAFDPSGVSDLSYELNTTVQSPISIGGEGYLGGGNGGGAGDGIPGGSF